MAALAVMLAAVGSLCGAVYSEAINPALYGEKSRAAVAQAHGMRDDDAVTAYIGMDAARQNEAAKIIALYMELGGEDTPLAVDELNEKELSHMNDVRRLIALCKTVRTACISLAAGLAVAVAWVGAGLKKRHRPVIVGAVCGVCALALGAGVFGAMMQSGGFETMFVGMHRMLFINDNWLLNPATDILIRMMPQNLFETALADVLGQFARALVLSILLLAAAYAVVSRHGEETADTDGGKTMNYEQSAKAQTERLMADGHATILAIESSCDETAAAIGARRAAGDFLRDFFADSAARDVWRRCAGNRVARARGERRSRGG